MRFRLTHPLPEKYWVAVSGGVDSMSVLHWLDKPSRRDNLLGVVHVYHGTEYGCLASEHVSNHCKRKGITLCHFSIKEPVPQGRSKEDWWREKRYEFFSQVPGKDPIILAHHMDDCLEEYLMCVLVRGRMGTIPYQHGRCIRPFRLWHKEDIWDYAERNEVAWVNDPSNDNIAYKRNYIRNRIVDRALKLNPGLYKIVKRAIDVQDDFDSVALNSQEKK